MRTVQIPVKVPWTREVWEGLLAKDAARNNLLVDFWADWETALERSPRRFQYFEDLLASMLLPGVPLERCRADPNFKPTLRFMMELPITAGLVGLMLGYLYQRSREESDYFTSPLQRFEVLTVACSFSESVLGTFSPGVQRCLGEAIGDLRRTSISALILAVNAHFGLGSRQMKRAGRRRPQRKSKSKCARTPGAPAGKPIPILAAQFGQWQCN